MAPAVNGVAAVPDALSVHDLGMTFDGRWALRDVDAAFAPGAVHGLVGHNGSGKSTLIRILAGYHHPTTGRVTVDGHALPSGSPVHSQQAGLRFVHQDLGLVGAFTALENFGLGAGYPTTWRGIDWRRQRARFASVLELLQCDVPINRPVSSLSAVQRSLIAIGRAVCDGLDGAAARVLVLDEPTTALEAPETRQLFTVIETLRASGVGVLYVSHHLDDVLDICADVTVLREGRVVARMDTADVTHDDVVGAMLGDAWSAAPSPVAARSAAPPADRPPALAVEGLRAGEVDGVDLELAAGECVAVVGLAGSGREEFVYALAGSVPSSVERLHVGGVATGRLDPRRLREYGVALVPGNRLPGSTVAEFSIAENLSLAALDTCTDRFGRVSRRAEHELVTRNIDAFDIRPDDPNYRTRYLSGGNKQKVVLARWLNTGPDVVLVDEPTAGVDVGAARAILSTLRTLADDGGAVLITTSELEDALAIADRVVVLNEGRVVRTIRRHDDGLSEDVILSAMTHSAGASAPAGARTE